MDEGENLVVKWVYFQSGKSDLDFPLKFQSGNPDRTSRIGLRECVAAEYLNTMDK